MRTRNRHLLFAKACFFAFLLATATQSLAVEPIPDRLIVMTFDDSVKSHYTVARPVLKKYGFGATFFITEGFTFKSNKKDYMTWEQIQTLHRDGFEIGNHTRDHVAVTPDNVGKLREQLQGIDDQCERMGIPKTVSFAWPGNSICREGLAALEEHGIQFARRGGNPEFNRWSGLGFAYEPGRDHHLLIPSAAVPLPKWTLEGMIAAAAQARNGRITIIQFHGVPEGEHLFVNTPQPLFEEFLAYLHDHKYKVIAVRDLAKYVDRNKTPDDPWTIIDSRLKRTKREIQSQ